MDDHIEATPTLVSGSEAHKGQIPMAQLGPRIKRTFRSFALFEGISLPFTTPESILFKNLTILPLARMMQRRGGSYLESKPETLKDGPGDLITHNVFDAALTFARSDCLGHLSGTPSQTSKESSTTLLSFATS